MEQKFILVSDQSLDQRLQAIEQKLERLLTNPTKRTRIPAPEFIKASGFTRQTFYNRQAKGLFQTEKIGGRVYVLTESVKV